MKLSVCIASRGRPELLADTIQKTLAHIELADTKVVVAVDYDDEPSMQAANKFGEVYVSWAKRPDTIAEKWNRVLHVAPADVYLPMSDYCPPSTHGFDLIVLEAASVFPDGIGVVYNHMNNLSFPQMQAVTAELVRLMGGKIYVEHFPYWFVDHWLDDIARMIGRISFADVWFNPTIKLPTQEMREPAFWGTFYDAMAPHRRRCAERILAAMDEDQWRDDMIYSCWPMIEERSAMINNRVRGLPPNTGGMDERYLRIKQRAVDLLKSLRNEPAREVA